MKVLFLTLLDFNSINERSIYTDLLREFIKNGHEVFAISPVEKRKGQKTFIVSEGQSTIVKLRIGNIQKTNVIEKGISTLLIEPAFKNAIKKYFSDIRFDLILYSTPPITFTSAIEYVKKRDGAMTYLLLKDIFPQNALDIGLLSNRGIKGIIYNHFKKQEKHLYSISDYIGCMSEANRQYIIKHNSFMNYEKVEICPNSIEVIDKSVDDKTRVELRKKYGIPLNSTVFVYGGNLGKPQDIPFIIECIKKSYDINNVMFLIIGDGTEYGSLERFVKEYHPNNLKLLRRIPKEDYDNMVGACDVGLVFLDYRFTIPNFPSRILSYMSAHLPIFAITDVNTDLGETVEKGNMGWRCYSNSSDSFVEMVKRIIKSEVKCKGDNAYRFLQENYSVKDGYETVINHME